MNAGAAQGHPPAFIHMDRKRNCESPECCPRTGNNGHN